MKHEGSRLGVLAIAAVALLGLSTEGEAQIYKHGYSYTQPAAELVMPYDTKDGKVSFMVVSNTSDRTVSTHWIFWNESCDEEVNFSICLTQNDTVVVDPRNMQALDANNQPIGPKISLSGARGVATVIAYELKGDCDPYPEANVIADEAIVGAFTFADTTIGYSFGNDALGLGTDYAGLADGETPSVQVPEPKETGDVFELAVQVFNPSNVENSVVVLTHLAETSLGIVVPGKPSVRFATSVTDTYEIPTSLPDTVISCSSYHTIAGDTKPLIPSQTTLDSSGIVRLQPLSGLVPGKTYVYGVVGQAVLDWGASSSVKVQEVEGSASPAFIDGLAAGTLF